MLMRLVLVMLLCSSVPSWRRSARSPTSGRPCPSVAGPHRLRRCSRSPVRLPGRVRCVRWPCRRPAWCGRSIRRRSPGCRAIAGSIWPRHPGRSCGPPGGTVVFAGVLAGRGVVSVAHPGGLRTTYEPVTATVAVGDVVARGRPTRHAGGRPPGLSGGGLPALGPARGATSTSTRWPCSGSGRVRLLPLTPCSVRPPPWRAAGVSAGRGRLAGGARRGGRTRRRGCRPGRSAAAGPGRPTRSPRSPRQLVGDVLAQRLRLAPVSWPARPAAERPASRRPARLAAAGRRARRRARRRPPAGRRRRAPRCAARTASQPSVRSVKRPVGAASQGV